MLYKIVVAQTAAELEVGVVRWIASGWKPLGGVAVSNWSEQQSEHGQRWFQAYHEFAQAMVRE